MSIILSYDTSFEPEKLDKIRPLLLEMLELCHKMGIENVGGNDYKEIRNLAKKLNINLVFSYKKNTVNQYHSKLDIQDILVENSKYQKRH